MNAEIALSMLGNALKEHCQVKEHTPLGEDTESDIKSFHESLQYFNMGWLSEEIEKICQKHEKTTELCYDDYLSALTELNKRDEKMYALSFSESRNNFCTMEIDSIPKIRLEVDGSLFRVMDEDGFILHNGSFCQLTPKEIITLFTNIDSKFMEQTYYVLASEMKDIVPEKLRSQFVHGQLTEGMCHSWHSNGSYYYGHEIRLKATDTHDMAYAYIPDSFWHLGYLEEMLKTVEESYWTLLEITAKLPAEAEFVCQDRDDFGVSFTDTYLAIDEAEYNRRKAVLMVRDNLGYDKSHEEQGYKDIMQYCKLEDRYTLLQFVNMCNCDIERLNGIEHDINARLGMHADSVSIDFDAEYIYIYLMAEREHRCERECFLRFPYETDLSFLKEIYFYIEKSNELIKLFQNNAYEEASVGLLRPLKSQKR